MLLELLGFYGIMLVAMFFFAEYCKAYPVGIIASVLIILLGLGVMTDGIQINAGTSAELFNDEYTNSTTTVESNDTTTMESYTSSSGMEETYPIYSDITEGTLNINILGIVLCLLGMYGMWLFLMKM